MSGFMFGKSGRRASRRDHGSWFRPGQGEILEERRMLSFGSEGGFTASPVIGPSAPIRPPVTGPPTGVVGGVTGGGAGNGGLVGGFDQILGRDLAALYQANTGRSGAGVVVPPSSGNLQVAGDRVLVEVFARADSPRAADNLRTFGFDTVATFGNASSGWLPVRSLNQLAAAPGLGVIRPVYRATLRSGSVVDQGDEALRSDLARVDFGVTGKGITIGILSDSFDSQGGAALGIASGDLPAAGVGIIQDLPRFMFGSDEGRAMAEIVHDIAPDASILFATAFLGQVSFARNIQRLVDAGADIIVDDVGYLTQPFYQDDIVTQAAQQAVARGVTFFSAAGNDADASYEARFINSAVQDADGVGVLHAFRPSRGRDDEPDTLQEVTIPVGGFVEVFLHWDAPFLSAGGQGAGSDMALFIVGADGNTVIAQSDVRNIGGDALEIVSFFNDGSYDNDGEAGADETFNIAISLNSGGVSRVKYLYLGSMQINEYATNSSTMYGQPNGRDVIAVAAAPYFRTPEFGTSPPVLEDFSSLGGTEILFDAFGFRTFPEQRMQPTLTSVDGADTTFFGSFFGTSAAAPHLAAVAALMLDSAGGRDALSPGEIRTNMIQSAIDVVQRISPTRGVPINIPIPSPNPGGGGFDFYSGYGFVDAYAAVSRVKNYAAIEGVKFSDDNGNGVRDAGEVGIPNFLVYLDLNRDGLIGYGEPGTLTDANGYYRFSNLAAGTYSIREAPTPGYELIAPLGEVLVTVALGQFPRVDLANRPRFDYGDAPAPYRTAAVDNGPRHGILPGLHLGATVDADTGSAVGGNADSDDLTGVDDEDGVTFLTEIIPGSDAYVQVRAAFGTHSPAALQAWIDFNGDGKWDAPGEQIVVDQVLAAGDNRLRYQVPVWAVPGITYARFRYAYERGLGPTGPAQAGEVEDYRAIVSTSAGSAILVRNDNFTVNPGSVGNTLDVLTNDLALRGTLALQSVATPSQGGVANISANRISYTPAVGFIGTETFTYLVTNGQGATGQGTVTVTVGTPSATLNASDDVFSVPIDSSRTLLNLLLNDLLPAGVTAQVTDVGTPNRGGAVTLATDGRSVLYTPANGFLGTETFTYTVTAGTETDTATVTVIVESGSSTGALARLRLRTTDASGNAITRIAVGQTFVLRGFVQDLSTNRQGVFAGYADVNYPASIVSVDGAIAYSNSYPNATSGSAATPGLIDELGSAANPEVLGGGEVLMFSIPFRATTLGTALFTLDAPDVVPRHAWVLFGGSEALTPEQVDLIGTSLIVTSTAVTTGANNVSQLDVNRDTFVSAIDALLILNQLNAGQGGVVGDEGPLVALDVNRDGFISAVDALWVINYLNAQSRAAQAAASGQATTLSADASSALFQASSTRKSSPANSDDETEEGAWDLFAADVAATRRS